MRGNANNVKTKYNCFLWILFSYLVRNYWMEYEISTLTQVLEKETTIVPEKKILIEESLILKTIENDTHWPGHGPKLGESRFL